MKIDEALSAEFGVQPIGKTEVIAKATQLNSFVSQIPNTQEKTSKKST